MFFPSSPEKQSPKVSLVVLSGFFEGKCAHGMGQNLVTQQEGL